MTPFTLTLVSIVSCAVISTCISKDICGALVWLVTSTFLLPHFPLLVEGKIQKTKFWHALYLRTFVRKHTQHTHTHTHIHETELYRRLPQNETL